jgi:hypothetical protein
MSKFSFRKVGFSFSSVFIFALHLPFVFAKSRPNAIEVKIPSTKVYIAPLSPIYSNTVRARAKNSSSLFGVYDSLRLNLMGLSKQAFNAAIKGYTYLVDAGKITNDKIISIIDFSLPSFKKRLFVLDVKNYKVIFNTYVAHGMNSGKEYAYQFSNTPETNKSSPGFYATADTYLGKNGYSLHLQGLEKGINDNASKRDIVIHGAEYVSENYIRNQGFIGRSWGCPALPMHLYKPIIDRIKNGTCLFIYSAASSYLQQSRILNHS